MVSIEDALWRGMGWVGHGRGVVGGEGDKVNMRGDLNNLQRLILLGERKKERQP